MIKGKVIFMTGGAGFIASTLASRLIADNEIVAFDNMSRDALQKSGLIGNPRMKLIKGDVRDFTAVREAVVSTQPTHIVHCAAVAGIETVIKSPVTTLDVNMIGTSNVLNAAHGVKNLERLVVFSTSEVFGRQAFLSSEETSAVIGAVGEARWTYAVSKLAAEHMALAHFHEFKLPTTVVRPFNVYGPRQVGEGALSTFVKRALRNEDIEIHGQGTQIRAWCYVDDMVDAVFTTIHHPAAVGQTFNIGNPRAVITIYGLANAVVRLLNSKSKIRFIAKDYADIELRVPDVQKSLDRLGFAAKVDLEEGIPLTADYYRTYLE
jgi:UDP-glucose 4-epimerase